MQCQICNKNEATIHLPEITDGVRTEMHICERCAVEQGIAVEKGLFGEYMRVSSINDGPVTFLLDSGESFKPRISTNKIIGEWD